MLLKYKAKLRFLKGWSGGVYMQVLKKRSLRWVSHGYFLEQHNGIPSYIPSNYMAQKLNFLSVGTNKPGGSLFPLI